MLQGHNVIIKKQKGKDKCAKLRNDLFMMSCEIKNLDMQLSHETLKLSTAETLYCQQKGNLSTELQVEEEKNKKIVRMIHE